jgi:hypothetical protein
MTSSTTEAATRAPYLIARLVVLGAVGLWRMAGGSVSVALAVTGLVLVEAVAVDFTARWWM